MTEMQKQFEEWFDVEKKHFINHEEVFRNVFWQVWQASRAAIVVKLPDWFVSGIDAAMYRDDVIKALNDSGVDYD